MNEPDPRTLDWPMPAPEAADEPAPTAGEVLQAAAEGIREDLQRVPDSDAANFVDLLARAFDGSPAPEESVTAVERLLRRDAAAVGEFVTVALKAPAAFLRLFVVLGHSRLLGRYLEAGGWRWFLAADEAALAAPVTAHAVADAARALIASGRPVLPALRENHHSFLLRVLYQEAVLKRPMEEVARGISATADGALQAALCCAAAELRARGSPAEPPGLRFCVIALGKHGAEELNYSSDIDVMFVFSGEHPGAQAWAVKLAERLIPLLDQVTEEGLVFRVDTRLRPEGKRGRLARSVQSTLDYYHSYGTTLERQALLKARACAGDLELGQAMLEKLQPWVFRKYLSVEDINRMQEVKRVIEKRTDLRAETFLDVKTGFGGIRDIEFITQFLQLLNGGRLPQLRERGTLPALRALAAHGVLKQAEAGELAQAYEYLRAVEHRLQLWEGVQTHTLPSAPAELARIGRCLGLGGERRLDAARQLATRLRAHTLRSRGLMVRLFAGLFSSASHAESELVLDPDLEQAQAAPVLGRYGFRDLSGAYHAIRELAEESPENRLYAPRARKYLASIMPHLLEFVAATPDPDATLRNFERIVANLGAKTMLFELIAEDPRALRIFGTIAAQSDWLSGMLAGRPGMVDEFIDELQTFTALDPARLRADLHSRMASAREPAEGLFSQRDAEVLRIGLLDITGRTPLPETLRELCVLAETLLDAALDEALRVELSRDLDGRPARDLLQDAPRERLAVVGLGKMGSGAMHYASDLDLVFVYDPAAMADPAQAQTFYARVVRRVLDLLTAAGERGKLCDVDLRLRPRGRAGTLATTPEELERYLQGDAGYWERIAACRARVLPGSGAIAARVAGILERFVYGAPADAAQMLDMRARVQREAAAGDLKRAAGGTMDIEFVLAHLQMRHGREQPALRNPDVLALLEAARQSGLLDARTSDELTESYTFLRQAINRLQLHSGQPLDAVPEGEELEAYARRLGYAASGGMAAGAQLLQELAYHRGRVQAAVQRIVQP
ncbi:MAG: bifunctional [glutamate--ammonia ligase]-adenylyl-L-tyrosine phosphorylase/[glutamate--ammonia-ligase] adenylyltransferase [Planctomycetes bacterium]|nr:bifunctional [glutamate--ammonia ligase]-adenylyl-L-tyrosine phosphorylase/[glutamate--ammonia-ligase] adenylyltransferase [Planctomycetota bacterium]